MFKKILSFVFASPVLLLACNLSKEGAKRLHSFSVAFHTAVTLLIAAGSILLIYLFFKKRGRE